MKVVKIGRGGGSTSALRYTNKSVSRVICREGKEPPGTTLTQMYRAQKLYQSAFHPDTGDLQNLGGRMCFNVYGGTILCGAMMIWYK